MRMSLRRYGPLGLLFLAAVAGLVGCGSPTKAVKVQGTVTLDGKPFPGATVTFTPVEATVKPASGRSEADGGFQLTTFKPDDGALPGDYKVVVTYVEENKNAENADPMKGDDKAKMAFFMKMNPQGRAKEEKKKASTAVPAVYTSPATTPLKVTVPTDGKVEIAMRSTAR